MGRQAATGHLGWLRGAIGAALGVALAGGLTLLLVGTKAHGLPWLVAPLGASAVLVFAVPASPLAQPWSVIGGDLLSAVVGLAAGHVLGLPWLAAGVAAAGAIAVMSLARCLHPPGGACALLCAMGATGPDHWSWPVLLPIAANVLVLVVVGLLYNNLTGHAWPHRAASVPPPQESPEGYVFEDLEAVLADWDEVLDIDVVDLDALFRAVQRRVAARRAA